MDKIAMNGTAYAEIHAQKESELRALVLTSGIFFVATMAAFGVLVAKILSGAPLL